MVVVTRERASGGVRPAEPKMAARRRPRPPAAAEKCYTQRRGGGTARCDDSAGSPRAGGARRYGRGDARAGVWRVAKMAARRRPRPPAAAKKCARSGAAGGTARYNGSAGSPHAGGARRYGHGDAKNGVGRVRPTAQKNGRDGALAPVPARGLK